MESLEHARQILRRDPHASILDGDFASALILTQTHGHAPTIRRIFERIVEHNQQELLESIRIANHLDWFECVEREFPVVSERPRAAKGLQRDRVEIDTSFRDIENVVATLRRADVVLLAYAPSNEGASAAVNCALAAGRATVLSGAKIFRPVAAVARVVDHDDPVAYADAVDALLRDEAERARLERAAADWASQHSYGVASRRILDRLIPGTTPP